MAQALETETRYLADFQAFQEELPEGASWLNQIRQNAWFRFVETGFPIARRGNEEWKYTSVAPIADAYFQSASRNGSDLVTDDELRRIAPWDDGWTTMVFVDGFYSEALSTEQAKDKGLLVKNLADAVREDQGLMEEHLTRHASVEDNGFIALNTAFIRDGAFVHIPDGYASSVPLQLLFIATDGEGDAVSHPRVLVVAGEHSRLTVIESYVSLSSNPYFNNAVTEIILKDGAEVEHYQLIMDSPNAYHVGMTRVHQGHDSTFSSTSFATGSKVGRNDLHVALDAPGSSCVLNGLYLTSGKEHLDNHISVDHAKPHTSSYQYYKGILDGNSRAVFSGKVLVRPDAQRVKAQQTDKNLLLSEGAEADSKPSLEIYADDVNCAHGATAGQIDNDSIFYMRSRGIDIDSARGLLTQGFAAEIMETVKPEHLLAYLEKWVSGALSSLKPGKAA